jgi:hypothetical protein
VKADQGSFTALVPSRAFVRRVTCAHNR